MSAAQKDWVESLRRQECLPDSYAAGLVDHLRVLADQVLGLRRELSRPVTVGINGGQGAGKSTLSLFLVEWLNRECGVSAASLSLDDLYLSKAKRLELANSIHPLFATRGVPGTHDVALGMRLLDKLLGFRDGATLAMPKKFLTADGDESELARFMKHFERLTRHMLETVPEYADTVIEIDNQHNLVHEP